MQSRVVGIPSRVGAFTPSLQPLLSHKRVQPSEQVRLRIQKPGNGACIFRNYKSIRTGTNSIRPEYGYMKRCTKPLVVASPLVLLVQVESQSSNITPASTRPRTRGPFAKHPKSYISRFRLHHRFMTLLRDRYRKAGEH